MYIIITYYFIMCHIKYVHIISSYNITLIDCCSSSKQYSFILIYFIDCRINSWWTTLSTDRWNSEFSLKMNSINTVLLTINNVIKYTLRQ